MKLYATIKNEKGKLEGIGGNELLTIEINRGNRRMVEFYLTIDQLTDSKELMVIDKLDLSDGNTTRVYEYEVNSKLPEYKAKRQKGECQHNYCDDKAVCLNCGRQQ